MGWNLLDAPTPEYVASTRRKAVGYADVPGSTGGILTVAERGPSDASHQLETEPEEKRNPGMSESDKNERHNYAKQQRRNAEK